MKTGQGEEGVARYSDFRQTASRLVGRPSTCGGCIHSPVGYGWRPNDTSQRAKTSDNLSLSLSTGKLRLTLDTNSVLIFFSPKKKTRFHLDPILGKRRTSDKLP